MNATGKPQAHPLQKLVAAFRVLAYGDWRILMATGEAKSREEHAALREDLCAHVFAQRGEFLKPYLD